MRERIWFGFLLTLILSCVTTATALSAPVTGSPVTILFVSGAADGDPGVCIDETAGFLDINQDTIISLVPVAEPGAYVELYADGRSVAGAWCDPEGKASFLSLLPIESSARLRIVQRSNQFLAVANGSIHRVTRSGSPSANPGLAVYGNRLLVAYESGNGQVSTAGWDWQLGTRDSTGTTLSAPPFKFYAPRPVADPAGENVWVYVDRQDGDSHAIYRLSFSSQTERLITQPEQARHDISIASTPISQTVYYTRPGRITEYHCSHTGSNGSSLTFLQSPPSLTHLNALAGPDWYEWVAGEQNGTVFVYRGSILKGQIEGSSPALARVRIDGGEYVYLTYLTKSKQHLDETILNSICFFPNGTPVGSPRQITSMPTGTGRIVTIGRGSELVVFWDQQFQGESQVFFTTIGVAK